MGWYSRFLTNYPWAVILADVVVVFICGPIGVWQAGVPDFSDPNEGYEPRGTAIRGRDIANTRVLTNLLNGTFTRIPGDSNWTLSNIGSSGSLLVSGSADTSVDTSINGSQTCVEEVIQGVTVRALPPALRATLNLPDSTALPRFVVQPKISTQSLWTAQYMRSVCEIENKHIKPFLETPCPGHSLPYYIGALQNKTCNQLTDSDMDNTLNLLKQCSSYYFSGNLSSSCDNNKNKCTDIPSQCLKHKAVYYIFQYLTDVDFFKDGNTNNVHLSYTLIIFRRSWNLTVDQLYDYYLANLEGKSVENTLVEVKGYDMDLIFGNVNRYYVLTDLPYYGLAMALVVVVLFLYLRSFALMGVVMLNVGLTLAVSYFIYHVVCRLVYFGFTNLLAGLLLIAIGADDVFIFFDIWHKIKHDAPNPDIANIEEIASHTISHAFLSILVTSLTTAAALFANAVSSVIALRCFGIFGGICIVVNLFFMVTLVPSVLVILEKITRKYPACCGCQWADKFTKPMNKLSKYIWGQIIPFIVVKGAVLWLIIFLAFGVYGFVAVFYKPQFKLPSSEKFQRLYSEHPFEVYKFKLYNKFRFEIENEERNKVNINLNFVFGVDGKDNGNVFDPNDQGILKLDDNFDIYPESNQLWLQQWCHNLLNDRLVKDSSRYVCFMDIYQTVVTSECDYANQNITLQERCCNSKFPLSAANAMTCLNNDKFVKLITRLSSNKTLIGAPIYENYGNNKLIAVSFQVETDMFWTPIFTDMDDFYNHFKEFIALGSAKAPNGLSGGWFSGAFGRELYFYDLQSVMVSGVILGIALSMAVAFIIMLVTSGNFFITLYAISTIAIVIAVTVGILVHLGWELGVSEALTITLAVGLSIDFTIHFGVAYKVSPGKSRDKKVEDAVSTVGFAVTMAAITTFLSGAALLGGRVISYYRFGVFLMLDMSISWVFALLFFLPVCKFIGPVGSFGEISALFRKCREKYKSINERNMTKTTDTPEHDVNQYINDNHTNLYVYDGNTTNKDRRANVYEETSNVYNVKINGIPHEQSQDNQGHLSSKTDPVFVHNGNASGSPIFVHNGSALGNQQQFGFTVMGSTGDISGSFKSTYDLTG